MMSAFRRAVVLLAGICCAASITRFAQAPEQAPAEQSPMAPSERAVGAVFFLCGLGLGAFVALKDLGHRSPSHRIDGEERIVAGRGP
jgi:hypothetical protein